MLAVSSGSAHQYSLMREGSGMNTDDDVALMPPVVCFCCLSPPQSRERGKSQSGDLDLISRYGRIHI